MVCGCAVPLAKQKNKNKYRNAKSHFICVPRDDKTAGYDESARDADDRTQRKGGGEKMFRMIFFFFSISFGFHSFLFFAGTKDCAQFDYTKLFGCVCFFFRLNRYSGPGELAFVGRCNGCFGCLGCTNFTHRNTTKTEASTELMKYT